MNGEFTIGLLGNIVVAGTIEARTGLHIGASQDTVEIGGIDSPVIKHPRTGEPYIPGSSLKGKMRSFMEKISYANVNGFEFNRAKGPNVKQHECVDLDSSYRRGDGLGAKSCPVCRVYGSTGAKLADRIYGKNHPARIVVRDCLVPELERDTVMEDGLYVFEAKMENAIDRMTAAAHPRTFERVPQGAKFNFEIVYKVQGEFEDVAGVYQMKATEIANIQTDVKNIFEVFSLIEKDGLGGSISRGYGQVKFSLNATACKYYQAGGGMLDYFPETLLASENPLEVLRQNNFDSLAALLAPPTREVEVEAEEQE